MPWCPVCKYEYKDGYETCTDCGAPLVATFEDIDKIEEDPQNHDGILNAADFALNEALSGMEVTNAFSDILEDKGGVFPEDKAIEESENTNTRGNEYKPFVKAKDRASEYKSSAFALLLVGILGIIFLILCVFNIIPLSINLSFKSIGFIAMVIVFVIFILVGIKSIIEAKTISELSELEDELVDNISDFFKTNHNRESIDELALTDDDYALNEELKFFKRDAVIRKLIIDKFGDIDSALLDNQVEVIYNSIFEE